jgi:hypothetical protein
MAFITLTNTGYIDYTLNCYKSLKNIGFDLPLHSYCIGKEGYNILVKNNHPCTLIDDEKNSDFHLFRHDVNWSNIAHTKIVIIYENLKKYDYVCITDGDIVFENKNFYKYLLDNIKDNDMLIQSEALDGDCNNLVCGGFIFLKSNEKTLKLFNPKNTQEYSYTVGWDEQIYVNKIKNQLKYKILPLELFPNGRYYYKYAEKIKPFMIHFNWLIGHEKKDKMIKYNKWLI